MRLGNKSPRGIQMDTLSLPLIHAGVSLTEALNHLKTERRSGLVVEDGDTYRLLHAGDLLRARAAGARTLDQVQEGEPAILLQDIHVQEFGIDLVRPLRTRSQFKQLLDS